MSKIAIIIPCFNEELTIANVISDCKKYLPQADIYVCDNNSTDNTAKIAKEAGVTVIYETKQGKGNVIRKMFREIDADCYVMIDGDGAHPLNYANDMCSLVLKENVDMVIGDRSVAYFNKNKRPFHNIGNKLVRLIINKIFRSNVKDIMSGYRVMSRFFVKSFPVLSEGFEIETEMTIHALDRKFTIREVPIDYNERPKGSFSKLNTFSDGFLVLKTIFSLFKNYKPFYFFSIIAFILFAVSMILFVPIFIEFLKTSKVPRYPTLIVSGAIATMSLIMWICGIILQTIVRKHNEIYEIMLNQIKNK
ncbi:MAG: glycosyltransferase [Elusimicrobia bacterium]|nr:glycosyltransferase [Elusimicrobiota bacterium]